MCANNLAIMLINFDATYTPTHAHLFTLPFRFAVPIIPEFLYDIRHPDAPLDSFPRTPLTTPRPTAQPCDNAGSLTTDGALQTTTFSAGKCVSVLGMGTVDDGWGY